MFRDKQFLHRKWWLILVVIVLAAGGGIAYWQFTKNAATAQAGQQSAVQTTRVRQGDLVISTTGTGTLLAGREANLGFSTSGTLAELHVVAGDRVQTGDVLARLDDIETLQTEVLTRELALREAQLTVDNLQKYAAARLAEAQLALAEAKDAYADAKSNLKREGVERCSEDALTAYYDNYMLLEDRLQALGSGSTSGDYYLNVIYPVKTQRDKAYATYMYCAGYTDYEIESSQATLAITEAEMKEAGDYLALLTENNGIDPDELALAQNTLASAQVAYNKAQKQLAGATLTAPFDGTIMSVAGQVGDTVGTATFITIADLQNPQLEIYVDETDMASIAVGYAVQIVFDALPDLTFTGTVTSVEPALVTVSGYQMVKGWVAMDSGNLREGSPLLQGLTASVEVIGGSAPNALLVPVNALRDLGDGEYAVFVLNADGEPRLRMVEVGLMDYTYAEIRSGLALGDQVTTGIVETN
jgi:RND family efflux transporter MFP subunit